MQNNFSTPFFSPLDETLLFRRIVMMSGPVTAELAYDINKILLTLEKRDPKAPIFMLINSPGGEVTSGFSIFDTARFIQPEIFTVVTGMAASMGSLIALCANPKNRMAFPNAKFLIHQPLINSTITGPASDLEIHAKDIVKTKEKINQLYAKETGQPIDVVAKATDRDNWLDTDQAKSFGLINKIITKCSELPGWN